LYGKLGEPNNGHPSPRSAVYPPVILAGADPAPTSGPAPRACPPKPEGRRRVTSIDFEKTKPICKNAKQPQTYAYKGLMKQLLRETAEKTKPICKNEKTNLTPCLKMTYEEKYPLRRPEKQTQNKPNLQKCENGPKPLSKNDLRKNCYL
jgi:hypothetical protein